MLTWAATAMAVMKTPSTPKGVKKVCRLRVSLKGTGSLRSSTPLHTISTLHTERKKGRKDERKKGRKEERKAGRKDANSQFCSVEVEIWPNSLSMLHG